MDKATQRHVLNILREGTITWSGRRRALERARQLVDEGRVTKAGKKLTKLYWKCAHCEELFRDESSVQVDHIDEVGAFNGDWNVYVNRMFCADDNLQVLCLNCHQRKTAGNAFLRFSRRMNGAPFEESDL